MSELEEKDWVICVVALTSRSPRKYKSCYIGVRGTQGEARAMQDRVAKLGFVLEEVRYFPDQIETITLKTTGEKADEQ